MRTPAAKQAFHKQGNPNSQIVGTAATNQLQYLQQLRTFRYRTHGFLPSYLVHYTPPETFGGSCRCRAQILWLMEICCGFCAQLSGWTDVEDKIFVGIAIVLIAARVRPEYIPYAWYIRRKMTQTVGRTLPSRVSPRQAGREGGRACNTQRKCWLLEIPR